MAVLPKLEPSWLKEIDCFANLGGNALDLLEQQMRPVRFEADQTICRKGDPADWMFVVGSGEVAVIKQAEDEQPILVAVLRSGEFGGMMSLFERQPRSATLRARGNVLLWVLDHPAFQRLMETCSDVSREMLAFMSRRMREDTHHLAQSLQYVTLSGLEEFYQACDPQERVILDEVNHRVAAAQSLGEIIDYLFDATGRISPTNRVALAFVEDDGGRVVAHYARADYEPLRLKPGYAEDLAGSSLRHVIESGTPRVINDLQKYLDEHPHSNSTKLVVAEGLRSSMTCPLAVEGRQVGLLFRSSRQPNAYNDHQVKLWQAVAERISQAVEKAFRIEQLDQANRAYMEMLGFVSHELKNPVASMMTDAKLITQGYLGAVDDKQKAKLMRLIGKGEYLLNLVREYMDLARIEGGTMAATFADEVNFRDEVIDKSIDLLEPQRAEKNTDIAIEAPDDLPPVQCDVDLMTIVMTNLIGNAIKYGNEDGQVKITLSHEDDKLKVSVWNTGPGFSSEQRSRLFRRFSRIDDPELKKRKGTGVGLYSTWRIIQLHHGRIDARSEKGAWAEFFFEIPQPIPAEPSAT